jgi:hypothetical protein
MSSYRKVYFAVLAAIILSVLSGVAASAQGPADVSTATPAASGDATPAASADPAGTADPAATADPLPAAPVPQASVDATSSPGWRFTVGIYGWFPGVHGTVGALGHEAGFSAPFSDVFHYLKGVIPIAVEADKGRFVMPIDFFWVKLANGKSTPFTDITANYVNVHLTESILTPKAGYRLYDGEHLKVDALAGIRYWYVGQNLQLIGTPVAVPAVVKSASWVDGLGGARFIIPLGEKAAAIVNGDAGGGGANLDYNIQGLLTYNFTPKLGLAVGWKYLYVNYRPGNTHQFVYDVVQSGGVLGMYYNFGGKPPIPPTASCSISPTEILAGAPVTATIATQNFNPKHTITYKWTSTGGKVSGTGTTGTVDTTGLAPGGYTVTGTATDEREKKNNVASCSASFTVKQPLPPVVSCSASPTTLAVGQPSTITMSASDPQGWPLTYSWTSTGGQLSGSGTSATLTAKDSDAGNTITVTGTATNDHNLSSSCTASVSVPPVEKCVMMEDWGECTFEKNPKKPWRVDNDCKDTLDKLSLRLQQMPNGRLNIVGFTNEEEVVNEQTLGAQRSVNVKYYLTTDGPNKVDASRVTPRQGGTKGQATHFQFVPEGKLCGGQLEEGTVVDESQVQPQSRTAPAPKTTKRRKAPAPPQN